MRILLMIALLFVGKASMAATVCLYTDINYSGGKFCWDTNLANGESNLTDIGWQHKVSSVSIEGVATVDFYDDVNFRGNTVRVNFSLPNIGGLNFNDRAMSVRAFVPAGRACFYTNAFFQGGYRCYMPGDTIPNLVPLGYNDQISSIRLDGDVSVYAYQDIGYAGARLWVRETVNNLQAYAGWNDAISSLHIVKASGQ